MTDEMPDPLDEEGRRLRADDARQRRLLELRQRQIVALRRQLKLVRALHEATAKKLADWERRRGEEP